MTIQIVGHYIPVYVLHVQVVPYYLNSHSMWQPPFVVVYANYMIHNIIVMILLLINVPGSLSSHLFKYSCDPPPY